LILIGTCRAQFSDLDEEKDYPEQNVQATYSKAKIEHIQPIIQQQTVQVEIEPKPTRGRLGQLITRTHQRLIDLAIDSSQDYEHIGMPLRKSKLRKSY
jgi:hypothetical protein